MHPPRRHPPNFDLAEIKLHESLGTVLVVWAQAFKLQQVVVNLLQNSLDALREKEKPRSVWLTSSMSAAGEVVLTIRDNAGGIPQDVQARVFDAFFSTKSEGLGLGLSICKRIVEEFGGSLEFEVEAGVGTVFALRLATERPLITRESPNSPPG